MELSQPNQGAALKPLLQENGSTEERGQLTQAHGQSQGPYHVQKQLLPLCQHLFAQEFIKNQGDDLLGIHSRALVAPCSVPPVSL